MNRTLAIFTLAAIIFAGATSCDDNNGSKKPAKSLFVETRGVTVIGDDAEYYAEMYALVANSIDIESLESGDIGFEYGCPALV